MPSASKVKKLIEKFAHASDALPMDEASRMARAKEMFPVKAYRGEGKPLVGDEYIVGHPDRKDTGWLGEGIYATNSPSVANFYASAKNRSVDSEGMNVLPLRLSIHNPKIISSDEKEKLRFATQDFRNMWLQKHLDDGHDSVVVRFPNRLTNDPNSPFAEEYLVPKSNQVRSVHAQFDPAKSESSNLLAGMAPGGLAMELLRQAAMADEPAPEGYAEGGKVGAALRSIDRIRDASRWRTNQKGQGLDGQVQGGES